MASAVEKFRVRFSKLWQAWDAGLLPGFKGARAVLIATGVFGSDEDIVYLKSFALVTWLFGAELQGCVVALSRKAALLAFRTDDFANFAELESSAGDGLPEIKLVEAEQLEKVKTTIGAMIAEGQGPLAVLTKEVSSAEGPIAQYVAATAKGGDTINVAPALASVLAVKDEEEEKRVKKAAILSAHAMKYALTEKIEKTIDQDRKTSHTALSDAAEDAIMNPSKVKLAALKPDYCESCYPPIIQSADSKSPDRKFDLRPSAESTDEYLKFGCIVASIGARFNFYCSNISRTLLIAPTNVQESVYKIVLAAQDAAIKALLPGNALKEAYHAAVRTMKKGCVEEKTKGIDIPDLVGALTKNVGFGMGIEFRDSALVLNGKNEAKVEKSMIFNVAVGVQNIKDPENGTYSILVADTVSVREAKYGPDIFTASSRKDFKHISYAIENEEDEDDAFAERSKDRSKGSTGKSSRSNGHGGVVDITDDGRDGPRGRRRAAMDASQVAETEEEEQKRRKHQEMLAKQMLDRGRARLKGGDILTVDDAKVAKKKQLDEYRAYPTPSSFPTMKPRMVQVDMEAESVIVPINGIPVPFHISTLKNATKSDEGQYSYLRVNFHTPQAATGRGGIGRVSDNAPKFPLFDVRDGSAAAYIKEFTYRSSNPLNLNDCLRKIKELRKRATEKATHAMEKQSLVVQRDIILDRGRKVPALSEVAIRPPMAKGKNNQGILEAHTNGFRYRCRSGHVDIIYGNIRNAFFQEANKELLVLLHFHLRDDIMIGTKKTKDVQFYVQVMEAVVKLNENRRRQFDQDELEEEQRERELRNRTNKNFLKFTKEVEERYGLEFDIPYRQLQFTGAPKSVAVTLLPTVSCIVNLTEWPPFVLNLEDVEIAHFERVIFQLRMFDIVFVFKGFEDDPAATGKAAKDLWLRINSVPMEELTPLKRYLDEQNIKYYEGKASLQWNEVLKSIRDDLEQFYEDGGWNFLSVDGPDEGEGGDLSDEDEDSLEGDAEFEPDPSEDAYESEDESSDPDSDSVHSDAVKELEGNSDEGEDELSPDEEGLTWDELERNAHAEDMQKGRPSDDEDDRRNKRRGSRSGGRSGGGGGRQSGSKGGAPSSKRRPPASSGRKRSRRER